MSGDIRQYSTGYIPLWRRGDVHTVMALSYTLLLLRYNMSGDIRHGYIPLWRRGDVHRHGFKLYPAPAYRYNMSGDIRQGYIPLWRRGDVHTVMALSYTLLLLTGTICQVI